MEEDPRTRLEIVVLVMVRRGLSVPSPATLKPHLGASTTPLGSPCSQLFRKDESGSKEINRPCVVDIRVAELFKLAIMVFRTIHIPRFFSNHYSRDHPEWTRRSPIQFSLVVVDTKSMKRYIAGSYVFQEDAEAG
jgi:hypothetical protein